MKGLLSHLDRRLNVCLQPAMPRTEEQRALWMPTTKAVRFPGPIMEKWNPPVWVARCGEGFWLAQNVLCYQRGFFPQELYSQYLKISGVCFNSNGMEERAALSKMAFDFLVVVVALPTKTVAAGCVVEFRPDVTGTKTPYLYISTLCTDPASAHRGLAHQMVHAVYTLGTLMLEQNDRCAGAWRNAIPNKRLFIGLTVRIQKEHEKLLRLYSQCGFGTESELSAIEYKSFTPFSVYNWQMNRPWTDLIPMYKEISSDLVYEDAQISIYSPRYRGQVKPMYHAFPGTRLQEVRDRGIVYSQHIHYGAEEGYYVTDRVQFSKGTSPPTAFRIHVGRADSDTVCVRISVPAWFAADIYSNTMAS